MRNYLNVILNFIGAESLTDSEFATVTATVQALNQATYDDLARILDSRESVSTMQERLLFFYKAKGVELTQFNTAKSNIFVGAVLD